MINTCPFIVFISPLFVTFCAMDKCSQGLYLFDVLLLLNIFITEVKEVTLQSDPDSYINSVAFNRRNDCLLAVMRNGTVHSLKFWLDTTNCTKWSIRLYLHDLELFLLFDFFDSFLFTITPCFRLRFDFFLFSFAIFWCNFVSRRFLTLASRFLLRCFFLWPFPLIRFYRFSISGSWFIAQLIKKVPSAFLCHFWPVSLAAFSPKATLRRSAFRAFLP